MSDHKADQKKSRGQTSCVRFNEKEYLRLQKDQLVTGQSIPSLLKNAYFKKSYIVNLLTQEEKHSIFSLIQKCLENLTQIREEVFTGIRAGFDDSIIQMSDELRTLMSFLVGKHESSDLKNR